MNDETKKDNLVSTFEHGDIELELEVMIPKGLTREFIFKADTKFNFLIVGEYWTRNTQTSEGFIATGKKSPAKYTWAKRLFRTRQRPRACGRK